MIILLKALEELYQEMAVEIGPIMMMITMMATIMMLERVIITTDLNHVILTIIQIMMKMISLTNTITIINIEVIFREEYLLSSLIKQHATQIILQESNKIMITTQLQKIS